MWISISELRSSNLKKDFFYEKYHDAIAAKGHSYEWLACGFIPESRILKVMPFDGSILYEEEPRRIIRSIDSREPWVFDWSQKMWVLRYPMHATVNSHKNGGTQVVEKKRHRHDGKDERESQRKKICAGRELGLNIVKPYLEKKTSLRKETNEN